ncbi:hypothetical protein WJX77_002634 [Trebouxia sp. C0004]
MKPYKNATHRPLPGPQYASHHRSPTLNTHTRGVNPPRSIPPQRAPTRMSARTTPKAVSHPTSHPVCPGTKCPPDSPALATRQPPGSPGPPPTPHNAPVPKPLPAHPRPPRPPTHPINPPPSYVLLSPRLTTINP